MKMNLANKLTIFRIILVIPLIVLLSIFTYKQYPCFNNVDLNNDNQYYLYGAGAIFIIAMITDFIDGWWARKHNKITDFGKLFDPLADKIIVTTSMVFLAIFNYTYVPIVVIFIIRDLIVDGSRNVAAKNNIKVEASIYGKLKTLFQSIALPILFFLSPIIDKNVYWHILLINIPMFIALVASIISGYLYFKEIVPFINKSK